jgi:hypothetical protein
MAQSFPDASTAGEVHHTGHMCSFINMLHLHRAVCIWCTRYSMFGYAWNYLFGSVPQKQPCGALPSSQQQHTAVTFWAKVFICPYRTAVLGVEGERELMCFEWVSLIHLPAFHNKLWIPTEQPNSRCPLLLEGDTDAVIVFEAGGAVGCQLSFLLYASRHYSIHAKNRALLLEGWISLINTLMWRAGTSSYYIYLHTST